MVVLCIKPMLCSCAINSVMNLPTTFAPLDLCLFSYKARVALGKF